MIRFLVRRIFHMIPTLLGILVITFLLFNLVGGSPASMTLGEKASAQTLEDFDEQRGFNKPLFFGHWTRTRALADSDFATTAGRWGGLSNVTYRTDRSDVLIAPGETVVPLAFPLRPGTYEIRIKAKGALQLRQGTNAVPLSTEGTATVRGGQGELSLLVVGEPVSVSSIQLRRRTAHVLDSQFVHFLLQVLRFDLGVSSTTNQPVRLMLWEGIGPTLMLTVPILVLETILSIGLALVCAYFRGHWPDRVLLLGCVALMSVNYIVWIIAGQYVFAYRLGWFPVWGFASWSDLLLPVLIGVFSGLGSNVRFYRTVMLDEMYKDYVRTAYAKGLGPVQVLLRHVLPNAMIPIVTNVSLSLPYLYTGSLLLESFFGIPGLGYLSVNAINSSDVDVVRAVVLVGSVLYLVVNLLTDLMYAWVDPRVRLS